MGKKTTFAIILIATLFIALITFFGGSETLSGFAAKNTQLISDNFLFAVFIILLGVIGAMGYLLKSRK